MNSLNKIEKDCRGGIPVTQLQTMTAFSCLSKMKRNPCGTGGFFHRRFIDCTRTPEYYVKRLNTETSTDVCISEFIVWLLTGKLPPQPTFLYDLATVCDCTNTFFANMQKNYEEWLEINKK